MATISSSGQKKTESIGGGLNFEQDQNRIIGRDENNLPRMLIVASGTDFSMKVSAIDKDVLTCTDDELIFNSNQNLFKISSVLEGNIFDGNTQNVTSNNTQVQTNLVAQIAHGQGRIPAFLAYVQLSGASYCLMPYTAKDIFGSTINNYAIRTYSVTADATYIYIILQVTQTSTSSKTVSYGGEPVKIYILQETAD